MRCASCLVILTALLHAFANGRALSGDSAQSRWKQYVAEHASRPLTRMLADSPTAAPTTPPITIQIPVSGVVKNLFERLTPFLTPAPTPAPTTPSTTPSPGGGGTPAGTPASTPAATPAPTSPVVNQLLNWGNTFGNRISGLSTNNLSRLQELLQRQLQFNGRRRLGEDEEAAEEEEGAGTGASAAPEVAGGEAMCFPLAAKDDNYVAVLSNCHVSELGWEDAGSCCLQCSRTANCVGYSYISGGNSRPRCCLSVRERYPLLALQGVSFEDEPEEAVASPSAARRRGLLDTSDNSVENEVSASPPVIFHPLTRSWGGWFKATLTRGLQRLGLAREPHTPFEHMVHNNPQIMRGGFRLPTSVVLDVQDSGAPGLVYLAPDSGFDVITGTVNPLMYNLNWYGCPYDSNYEHAKCSRNPPPTCRCTDGECTGYCAPLAPRNFVLPKFDYYSQPDP